MLAEMGSSARGRVVHLLCHQMNACWEQDR